MNNNDYSLRVINLSGSSSITGRLIKVNTARSNSFTLLGNNETNMLGVIVEGGIASGLPCGIKVNGSAYVYVNGVVKQGGWIRSLKSGDSGAKGTAVAVKISDVSYLQVGIALESGSNKMILVALNVAYISPTTSLPWGSITGIPTTFPPSNPTVRIVTDTTTELTPDDNIICNKGTAMTVNLLAATGSGRIIHISSIGLGQVTIDPTGGDTIDGETTQTINQYETISIHDYFTGKFKII